MREKSSAFVVFHLSKLSVFSSSLSWVDFVCGHAKVIATPKAYLGALRHTDLACPHTCCSSSCLCRWN